MSRTATVTGLCGAAGGAAWVAACFAQNALPQGCIGDGCATRPMRGSSALSTTLAAVALLLVAAAAVGLLLLARRRARLGRSALVGAVSGALGVALLLAAGTISAIDDTWSGMPALVVPGVVLLAAGFALLAWAVLRAGVVPRWAAVLMLACAVLLLLANEQTSRVLWGVPFGIAWMVAGGALLRPGAQAHVLPSSAPIHGNS